jgi:gliding motility-associated-like protein
VGNVTCNGDASGQVRVAGFGGNPPYEFSVDGTIFQSEDLFGNLPAGTYTFTILDALGCTETVQATIIQPPPLSVDAGPDQTIGLGFDTRVRAIANAANVTFQWFPADSTLSCSDCPNPRVFPMSTTLYTVVVRDGDDCTALDSLQINVTKDYPVYFPSGFSPNGDGANDYYTVLRGPAVNQVLSLRVFDRWGELIYEGENLPLNVESAGWDGTFKGEKMDSGVFVYLAEIQFIDGEVAQYQGDVSLLR